MSIRAFIFDLDGVITDTAHYHYLAWKRLADYLEMPFNEQDNERLKGVSRMRSLELIVENSGRYFSEEEKEALCERKNDDYLELIATITPADILPGVHEVFSSLRERGIKTGLASASKNAAFVVERLGMYEAFDFIGDARNVANSKPAPDIFLANSAALGLDPAACVGIEDAAAGVESIRAAGMFSVGVGDALILKRADMVFPDMASLDVDAVLQKAG